MFLHIWINVLLENIQIQTDRLSFSVCRIHQDKHQYADKLWVLLHKTCGYVIWCMFYLLHMLIYVIFLILFLCLILTNVDCIISSYLIAFLDHIHIDIVCFNFSYLIVSLYHKHTDINYLICSYLLNSFAIYIHMVCFIFSYLILFLFHTYRYHWFYLLLYAIFIYKKV